jgi:hypothetical protein
MQGMAIKTFHREHLVRNIPVEWNGSTDYGKASGNGYYIVEIKSKAGEEYVQPFMFVQ